MLSTTQPSHLSNLPILLVAILSYIIVISLGGPDIEIYEYAMLSFPFILYVWLFAGAFAHTRIKLLALSLSTFVMTISLWALFQVETSTGKDFDNVLSFFYIHEPIEYFNEWIRQRSGETSTSNFIASYSAFIFLLGMLAIPYLLGFVSNFKNTLSILVAQIICIIIFIVIILIFLD